MCRVRPRVELAVGAVRGHARTADGGECAGLLALEEMVSMRTQRGAEGGCCEVRSSDTGHGISTLGHGCTY
jgi:hypothetical protein